MTRFLFFCRGLSTAPGLRPDRPVQGQGQGQGQEAMALDGDLFKIAFALAFELARALAFWGQGQEQG